MKKIYIAGGGGMLGEGMYKIFKDSYNLKCTDIDTNQEWLDFLDFRNNKEYNNDVTEFNPSWLFHLGAYTDLEFCEKNGDETYITNTESVKTAVAIACRNILRRPNTMPSTGCVRYTVKGVKT